MARRFWTVKDVADWIEVNAPPDDPATDSTRQAVWWACYRDTQALVDDTIRHIAQSVMGGVGPYSDENVTDRVQDWMDEDGNEGEEATKADAEIEADLRKFFIGGR